MFFHAHPDDEAIFSGGTIARLAAARHRVVVVMATSGDLGLNALDDSSSLAEIRERELSDACRILGVEEMVLMRYVDSGLDDAAFPPGSFATADVDDAARQLAAVLRAENATTLVVYDEGGIYGHPDHVQVHRVGTAAARLAGIATVYEMTVDREYLHFVDTHLIDHAREALPHIEHIGLPTVFITTMLDVRGYLTEKRAAIAAHASQVHDTSSVMQLRPESFSSVYGYEWYLRNGPPGIIDTLIDTW